MAVTVCIKKDDQGAFSVYKEQDDESNGETMPKSMSASQQSEENQEQAGAQQAPDLKSALIIAAKLLSVQDDQQQQSMFDQGLAKTLPVRR